MNLKKNGSFTISLDFELYWGVRDKRSVAQYKENLVGVWEVIPKMLLLFQKYNIHVTWATVGFLFLEDEKEFLKNIPSVLPQYENGKLCPYKYFNSLKPLDFSTENFIQMHFAKKLIDQINTYPFQEIATHTYSHYYTREPIISIDAFVADINKAIEIGENNNIKINSLVFPRNQIDINSLKVLEKLGVHTYRGNPSHWAYKDGEVEKTFLQRVYRFFDIYINLSGSHTTVPRNINDLKEVKSSIFFRSYSRKFKFFEWFKIHRIKTAMTEAAKNGENFHLWWHPHNFGVNQQKNMQNLEKILEHYSFLQEKYNMNSLTMQELGTYYE